MRDRGIASLNEWNQEVDAISCSVGPQQATRLCLKRLASISRETCPTSLRHPRQPIQSRIQRHVESMVGCAGGEGNEEVG